MSAIKLSTKIASAAAALRDGHSTRSVAGFLEGEVWRKVAPHLQARVRAVQLPLHNGEMTADTAATLLEALVQEQGDLEPIEMTRAEFAKRIAAAREAGREEGRLERKTLKLPAGEGR